MYICLECQHVFENPVRYIEKHCLDSPPYEEWDGCPLCGGSSVDAYQCECCGEWIKDAYIKIEHRRYCQDCYQIFELGDEY